MLPVIFNFLDLLIHNSLFFENLCLQSRDLVFHDFVLFAENLLEGIPLSFYHINPKPFVRELIPLGVKKLLACFQFFQFMAPELISFALKLLYFSDKQSNIIRCINGQRFKVSSCFLNLDVKVSHIVVKCSSKSVKDFFVPLVVLVVDFLLDTTIVDDYRSEILLVFTSIKSLPSLSNFVQKLLPFVNIVT